MPRILQYPDVTSLEKAGAHVSFSAQALRLMWRIELSAPEHKSGPEPQVVRVPASIKTEWRVWGSEPGTKANDIATWSPEDFSTMEPFSDDHPFANKPLTEPPTGSFQLRINNLEHYAGKFWPEHHWECYDHKAWPRPGVCSHGVPAPARPPVLHFSAEPDRPFIRIGDYVRHVSKWIKMDFVARDLHRAWSDMGLMRDGKVAASCSPCDGGIVSLHFTIRERTKAQWKRLAEQYNSSLHRDDDVEAQNQARRDRRTAELMKRNPYHEWVIGKALSRREDGFGFDLDDEDFDDGSEFEDWVGSDVGSDAADSALSDTVERLAPLPQSMLLGPGSNLSSKWDDPSFSGQATGRYPTLRDLRYHLCAAIPKSSENADVIFSLAAEQLRWTVQLKRQSPGTGKRASLKSDIKLRNCLKPYNILPWNPSSNTASQPVTQPCVGSITIRFPELMARESRCTSSHRKCNGGEAPDPEENCRCGQALYHAPELTVEAAEGSDFVTVGDYVASVTKWMEGEDVAGVLAEEWFPEGKGGCKRARVELLDPAFVFLGLYEEKGCDLTEEEDRLRWMDTLVNHMDMAHDPWAEKSAHIAEGLRGQPNMDSEYN